MQIEPTSDVDRECKDLIGEAYEAAHTGFSDLDALWKKVEAALARKGALELCTTGTEDSFAQDILKEVFEEACTTADEEGRIASPSAYVDYNSLWERICTVIGVSV